VLRVRSEISLADKSARKGKGKKGKAKLETDEGEDEESEQSESDDEDEYDGVNGSAGPAWEEYTIADTRPLLQGILDATRTLIVILPPTAKTTPSVTASAPLPSSRPDAQHVDNLSAAQQRPKRSLESPLLLSSFILPSCRSQLSSNASSADLDRSDDLKPAALETSFLSRPLATLEPGISITAGAACLGSDLTCCFCQRLRGGTRRPKSASAYSRCASFTSFPGARYVGPPPHDGDSLPPTQSIVW
jgi:hypothetical protein